MEYDATPETEIRPNTDNQPKFKAKFLFFLLNIDSGSRSASYAILFAQCFLFFRDITKTLSIFFGKLLKITYWRDVKRGYVFIKNIALLNLNIAQTAQAHRVTLHILLSFWTLIFLSLCGRCFQNVNKHFLSYYCASSLNFIFGGNCLSKSFDPWGKC